MAGRTEQGAAEIMDELCYEKKILIRSEQVNMMRTLRTSDLFRMLEEASIAHTEELGCTRHKTLDRGLLWVITRQTVEIDELPAYDEEILLRSWPGDMMHVFFPRHYEVIRGGKSIIRGQALWVLINEETRGIAMPEDYSIEIPGCPGMPEVMIPAIRIPASAGGPVIEQSLTTRFSQVDINGHMNNTRYFDIIDDALGAEFLSAHTPERITANYLSELRAGDSFTLRGHCEDGMWYFEGMAGKPAFRMTVSYR